jgi:hypothetical protein
MSHSGDDGGGRLPPLQGARFVGTDYHGLTPVATPCRPLKRAPGSVVIVIAIAIALVIVIVIVIVIAIAIAIAIVIAGAGAWPLCRDGAARGL